MSSGLSWLGIIRLGLVQSALGAIIVLTTSTMNRIMVVELALPAMIPGALVTLHHALQMLRPRFGHGSDVGGRRTPWIVGGMFVLATGGVLAAVATAWIATAPAAGVALAVLAFALIGVGVGAAGTTLLVLLAKQVVPERRPAAATIVWVMMIVGFVLTTAIVGSVLDPYTPERLIAITSVVAVAAVVVAALAVRGIERESVAAPAAEAAARPPFRAALAQVWAEPEARQFTIFVFASMLAYSAQDLILEPFAGAVFGFTPGETTRLSGLQHGGVLAGMALVALAGGLFGKGQFGSLRGWVVGGCIASAIALGGLVAAAWVGEGWPLRTTVFALGVSNGAFAIAAIASMMSLAGRGRESREGVRMGLWGAAQAIAFGVGGFAGTVLFDVARALGLAPAAAYASVFALEALVFLAAARIGFAIGRPMSARLDFGLVTGQPGATK